MSISFVRSISGKLYSSSESLLRSCRNFTPSTYHREYKNDIRTQRNEPHWLQTSKRAVLAAAPLLSLHKSFTLPIALSMGTARVFTQSAQLIEALRQGDYRESGYHFFHTSLGVASVAGTLFAHPAGMLLSTGHDLLMETTSLLFHLQQGRYQEALENTANLVNNSLYLAFTTVGGLEIAVASFAMQAVVSLYHSRQEFKEGRYIEGCSHLLMALVRAKQVHTHASLFHVSRTLEENYSEVPKEIIKLAQDVISGREEGAFLRLKQYWQKSTLKEKDAFVRIFNDSRVPVFQSVRGELAGLVYRSRFSNQPVEWLSPDEVDQRIGNIWDRTHGTTSPYYYHATNLSALEGILKTKQVEVRHERAFRGAFVSTAPELYFGNYVLAFNRTIERKSSPLVSMGGWLTGKHWLGFSQAVPVTRESLSGVILVAPNAYASKAQLERDIEQWVGWKVPVVTLDELNRSRMLIDKINMGVPKEWS